jgi:hypothetical protein
MDDITRPPHGEPHPELPHHAPENANVSHERGDADVFTITKYGIGLAIGVVVVVFLMWGMFDWFYARESDKPVALSSQILKERPTAPPEPRLQSRPKMDLRELRESEETALSSYGWINPDAGTVRIPIDQAIDMVAKKGLPSKPSPAGAESGYRQIPSYSSSGREMEKVMQ